MNNQIPRLPPGMIRVSVVANIPLHLREWGVDPEAIIRADGFDLSVFDDPDRLAPYADLVRVLNSAAVATGCGHFGLLLGETASLGTLRTLGDEMRKSRSIRAAIELLQSGYSTFDRGGVLSMTSDAETVDLRYVLVDQQVTSAAHVGDVFASVGCNILADLCGPEWKPSAIKLSRRRPADESPYRNAFKCPIEFNQLATSIQFPAAWLARPVQSPLDGCKIGFVPDDSRSIVEHIARICITTLIAGHVPSSRSVAREVAVSERTLLRRLEEHGESFSSVFAQTRQLAAMRLLNDTDAPLKDISQALGYSELSAFTRAFRGWTGQPPSHFRDVGKTRGKTNASVAGTRVG